MMQRNARCGAQPKKKALQMTNTNTNQASAIIAFAAAHPETARQIFDASIAAEGDAERRASLELLREYFTNPAFKSGLEDYVFSLNR